MGQKGFEGLNSREILFRLMHLHNKPTLGEIQHTLTRLSKPMDRLAPIEMCPGRSPDVLPRG